MATDLRISGARGPKVRFRFDGREIEGFAGESVAAALLAQGIRALRNAPLDGGPRGLFCAMGICQECVVLVNGRRVESCRLIVSDGLDVRRVE